ncbi:MAG: hypothetical protein ABFD08_16470 [Syntrophomonas sp.]
MKQISGWLALVIGVLLGFFGVFVSVFSDGSVSERLITIVIILVIYAVLSAVWGFWKPKYSWLWGLILGMPGVLFLGFYMIKEFNAYYLIYVILIIILSCVSAYGGSALRNRKK